MNAEKRTTNPVKKTVFTFKSKAKGSKLITSDPTGQMTGTSTCSTATH